MFFFIFDRVGIYSSLNATGLPTWEREAGQWWWAHPGNGTAAFLFEAGWMVFILYYMFRHNVVGCIAVLLAREVLQVGNNGPLIILDPDHPDGFGGMRIVRVIM